MRLYYRYVRPRISDFNDILKTGGTEMRKLNKVVLVCLLAVMIGSVTAGTCLANEKNIDKALSVFQSLLRDFPENSAEWYMQIGVCYTEKGDYENAKKAFTESIKISPDAIACVRYAECLCEEGKVNDGIAYLDSVVNLDRCTVLFFKGSFMDHYDKKYQEAEKVFYQVFVDYPNSAKAKEAYVRIALINLWYYQKTEVAREMLSNPPWSNMSLEDEVPFKFNLAYCSYVQDNWSSARDAFQYVYDHYNIRNYQASALYMVADCLVHLGDNAAAQTTFERVISEFPESAMVKSATERVGKVIANQKSKPVGLVAESADTKVAKVALLEKNEGHINEAK